MVEDSGSHRILLYERDANGFSGPRLLHMMRVVSALMHLRTARELCVRVCVSVSEGWAVVGLPFRTAVSNRPSPRAFGDGLPLTTTFSDECGLVANVDDECGFVTNVDS